MQIRIVAVPPGEAPLEVRKAWVGLCLPIVDDDSRPRDPRTSGVVTGPKSFFSSLLLVLSGRARRVSGYRVDARTAIDILEKHAPDAANWWNAHAPPRGHHRNFVFHAEVCEVVE